MAKMTRLFGLVSVLAMSIVFAGCATKIMDLTVASTKNVDLSRMGEFQRSGQEIKGTSTRLSSILFFTVNLGKIDMEVAMDNALKKIPGAVALVDFTLNHKNLNFLLFGLEQYVVTGIALVDPNIVSSGGGAKNLPELVKFDETGDVIERTQITIDEFNQYLAKAEYKINQ
jgi:hypothetical protein